MLRLILIISLLIVGPFEQAAAAGGQLLLRFRYELRPIGDPAATFLNGDVLIFGDRLVVSSTSLEDGGAHVTRSFAPRAAFRRFRDILATNRIAAQRGTCGTVQMPIPPAYTGTGTVSFVPRRRSPISFAVGQEGAAPCSDAINHIVGAIFDLTATSAPTIHLPAP